MDCVCLKVDGLLIDMFVDDYALARVKTGYGLFSFRKLMMLEKSRTPWMFRYSKLDSIQVFDCVFNNE